MLKNEALQHVQLNRLTPLEGEKGELHCSHPQYVTPLDRAQKEFGLYIKERIIHSNRRAPSESSLVNHTTINGGAMVYIPKGERVDQPIVLELSGRAQLHLFVVVEPMAQVSFIVSPAMGQCYIDLNVHKGANVNWLVDSNLEKEHSEVFHMESEQQRDSHLLVRYLSAGSPLSRFSFDGALQGEGAFCDFRGFAALKGDHQVHVHSKISHNAPSTQSNQLVKNLLAGQSKTSFTGKIFVDEIAQQTNAYQLNRNLLLSPTAVAHAKPNLEVFADDVKASHGATIASIDEELRFYFHSRGLSLENSRRFLVRAFVDEMIENDPKWVKHIDTILENG